MPDVGAVVAAAGRGSRLGAGRNKVFLTLRGKPILLWAVGALAESSLIGEIVVAVAPGEEEECRRLLEEYRLSKVEAVVAGGPTRQESVRKALGCLSKEFALVAVHDGARPFVSEGLLAALVACAARRGAAIPGVPVKDTVKLLGEGESKVWQTLPRERLVAAQTPQVFRRELLEAAHQKAAQEGFTGTDDAALVERLGHPVWVVEGDYRNLKITTREDLQLAEFYCSMGMVS
jgi:2-C-methyl-D-erythritol 4-phosphate cytidylyltransferase